MQVDSVAKALKEVCPKGLTPDMDVSNLVQDAFNQADGQFSTTVFSVSVNTTTLSTRIHWVKFSFVTRLSLLEGCRIHVFVRLYIL
ncbi:hypothetical protein BaRGS_00035215 [Batillaria attramentaria]|uniref:Uncharacterized protein n=1 Tax=Batillaria attramentaria TaxID=370345 RepID=A0ABD0JF67_9CAEN